MLILGVVKLFVVARAVPPVGLAYQKGIPPPTLDVAPSITEPASQRLAGVVDVIVGVVFTVAITAILEEAQLALTVST